MAQTCGWERCEKKLLLEFLYVNFLNIYWILVYFQACWGSGIWWSPWQPCLFVWARLQCTEKASEDHRGSTSGKTMHPNFLPSCGVFTLQSNWPCWCNYHPVFIKSSVLMKRDDFEKKEWFCVKQMWPYRKVLCPACCFFFLFFLNNFLTLRDHLLPCALP